MGGNDNWYRDFVRHHRPDGGALWPVALREEIDALARTIRQPVVLDVGCGLSNNMSPRFLDDVGLRVGIDIDRVAGANRCLDVFAQASACRLPLTADSVDILLCGYVVEHLADPLVAFREFHRVLRPGGTAFVWTPNLLNYAILASAATPTAFHNWVRHQAFPEDARDNCPTYYRANTPGALTRSLCTAGLRLEGGLRFGAGSYQYWRFSRPLFAAAVLGSNLIARSPLRRLMNVLLARCVKPAG